MRWIRNNPFSPFWFDRSSPLADRLTILWHAAANQELVSGTFGVLSGTTPPTSDIADLVDNSRVLKINGVSNSATQSYISLGSKSQYADIALQGSPFTMFAVMANNGPGPIMGHNDNNTINAGWVFDISGGSQMRIRAEHASANFTASVTIPFGTPYNSPMFSLCFTCDGSQSATAGTALAYVNGVKTSTAPTLSAGSGVTGSDAGQTLYIGGNQAGLSGGSSLTSVIEMCAVWRRMLQPGEIQALANDRLQLFRRRTRLRTIGVTVPVTVVRRPVVQVSR